VRFTFVDLFAGIGGFHAALSPLGGQCVFASEIDNVSAHVYSSNWLGEEEKHLLHGDIRPLTETKRVHVPNHDVLTAGFPCQPFSKSGNQLGVNEARGTLFFNILKVIEAKKPQAVLLENVRNLYGPRHIEDYRRMIKLLRQLGYAVSDIPTILSPHEIPPDQGGTPQHRQRLFIGAVKVGSKRAQMLKGTRPLLGRDPFSNHGTWEWSVHEFLDSKEVNNRDLQINEEQSRAIEAWQQFLMKFRKQNRMNPPGFPLWSDYWVDKVSRSELSSMPEWKQDFVRKNHNLFLNNMSWLKKWLKEYEISSLIPSYRKFEWQAGFESSLNNCLIQFRPSGIRAKLPTYVPTFVAITQTPVVGWERRTLSVKECLVLQGFPKNFDFSGVRRNEALKQIGNSVHPAVAQLVFRSLVDWGQELGHTWSIGFGRKQLQLDSLPSFNDQVLF